MNNKPHPYLNAALICEKVLEEKTGNISVMRIIDKIGYRFAAPQGIAIPADLKPAVQISALISLKAGSVTGSHTLKLIAENPIGKRTELFNSPFNLVGEDQGQNFVVTLTLGITVDGLYWFDVVFDDEVLTRIPITIAQESLPAQMEQSS